MKKRFFALLALSVFGFPLLARAGCTSVSLEGNQIGSGSAYEMGVSLTANCTPDHGGTIIGTWGPIYTSEEWGTGTSFTFPGNSGKGTGFYSLWFRWGEVGEPGSSCPGTCGNGAVAISFTAVRIPAPPQFVWMSGWKKINATQWARGFKLIATDPDQPGDSSSTSAGAGNVIVTSGNASLANPDPEHGDWSGVLVVPASVTGDITISALTSKYYPGYGDNLVIVQSPAINQSIQAPSLNPGLLPPPACTATQTCGPGGSDGGAGSGGGNSGNGGGGCVAGTTSGGITACGLPVNVATGAHWDEVRDFSLPGQTPSTSLEFDRVYTAFAVAKVGDFGPNWRHSYETTLQFHKAGALVWVDEHGVAWTLPYKSGDANLEVNPPPGLNVAVKQLEDHIEIAKRDKTVLHFNYDGQLIKVVDQHGVAKTMTYGSDGKLASVSVPLAGTLTFGRDSEGRITSVTRSRDNLTYTYSYNSDGRLETATDFNGKSYHYTYVSDKPGTAAQGMLASITDPLGRVNTFTYYDDGKAFQQFEAGGGTRTFVYSPATGAPTSTMVTEIDGSATTYKFDNKYRTIETDFANGGKRYVSWNAQGFAGTSTDELGYVTTYGHDSAGNLSLVKRPEDPAPTTTVYDSTFNVPTLVTPPVGAPTQYMLDPNTGDVASVSRSNGSETLSLSYTRDAFGNILSTNNGRATYADQRDANGLLIQVFDLHNPETRTYDDRSRLTARIFQSGRMLTYVYDDYDRVVSITDSAGPTSSFTYDAMGRLLSRTITDGHKPQVTTYVWDEHDRMVSETDALGRTTSYAYDNARILRDPSSITDPAGRVTSFTYDLMGRKLTKMEPNGAVTHFAYNLRGDLTSVTDANGNVTSYEYDGNGRKKAEIRPSVQGSTAVQQRTEYSYDARDHLILEEHKSTSGGQSRIIAYQYDSFDRLARKILKNGSVVEDDSTFTYENQLDANSMSSAINGLATLNFAHEPAPPFASTAFSQFASESGNPKGLIEDQFSIARDVTGKIASISGLNFGPVYSKTYDPAGRLIGVEAGALKTALRYDGFGRRDRLAHSDGKAQRIVYDSLNRITKILWKEGSKNSVSEQLEYDLTGNIIRLNRENARYKLSYDENDQLVESRFAGAEGVPNYSRSFQYDLLGNRIGGTLGAGAMVGNFLAANGSTTYFADADGLGQVVKEASPTSVKSYTYRADGKISSFQEGLTQANYFYDGLGRLAAKTLGVNGVPFTQSFFNLAEEGRVLLGKAGDGSVTSYVDGQGIAERLGETKSDLGIGYITDHLGSILNSPIAGSTRSYGLFGELGVKSSISPISAPVSYGFTGHMVDMESGLNRTPNRLYDSKIGRWLNQDPIGSRSGDQNYYRYVKNNSLKSIDPTGLRTRQEILADATALDARIKAWLARLLLKSKSTKVCKESGDEARGFVSEIEALSIEASDDDAQLATILDNMRRTVSIGLAGAVANKCGCGFF